MNGIDPPTPMCTGSTPQALVSAHRAASYTGPWVAPANGRPCSTGTTSTWAPNGAAALRWAASASNAAPVSWPGATRIETFTRTEPASVLDAAATDGASMPTTVIDGLVHSR